MKRYDLSSLTYDAAGLIPAVVQDVNTGAVLMVAWMNRESLDMTLESGFTHFWSRSRQKFWKKGETSGHVQKVHSLRADCDGDTLLVQVEQEGPACHTNSYSCFYNNLQEKGKEAPEGSKIMEAVYRVILDRKYRSREGSYVAALLDEGREKILAKVKEEAGEVTEAARSGEKKELVHEVADLWFHTLVLLGNLDIAPGEVFAELAGRYRPEDEG